MDSAGKLGPLLSFNFSHAAGTLIVSSQDRAIVSYRTTEMTRPVIAAPTRTYLLSYGSSVLRPRSSCRRAGSEVDRQVLALDYGAGVILALA